MRLFLKYLQVILGEKVLALEHAQEREPPGSLGMLYVITNTLHRNPCDDKI